MLYSVICFLIPAIMIVIGYIMRKHPPKKPNSVIGYRTPMSKKNAETWAFAHSTCGRIWLRFGVILAVAAAAALAIIHTATGSSPSEISALVIVIVQLIILVLTTVPVEKALRREFDSNGNRR